MKGTKSALLVTALLVLVGCGGGGSTDGAGGGTDGGGAGGGGTGSEAPAEVAGSYDAVRRYARNWQRLGARLKAEPGTRHR